MKKIGLVEPELFSRFLFILMCIASSIKINIFVFDLEEDMTQSTHYYKDQKIGY